VIVGLTLICRSSYRGVVEFLRDLLGVPVSLGSVHHVLQSATRQASAINHDQDLSGIRVGLHDEIFQGATPASVVQGSGGGSEALSDVRNRPPQLRMPILPFKLNQDRRRHIPRQRHRVTNSLGALLRSRPAYDASLRQRGSLTVWFTDDAIAGWAAEPRTTRGGQPWYSSLAILTALTLRAVFRLAYRQAEGLLGSVIGLLGLALPVPDHTTLSRRAATLEVPRPGHADAGAGNQPMHLLVDSTGLKLCGKGEWLLEKHGMATRRSWRMVHLGVDAETGRIVASTLTRKDVDDASQAGLLLDQVAGAVASFTGDGAYDRDRVYAGVAQRHPDAAVVVPPRANAVPSDTAESAPTQRDGHLQRVEPRGSPDIAEHGRMAWQNASGYNKRARVEATMNRWKQVIGDELRAHTDERRASEVAVAVHALNRMLDLRRSSYARVA